MQDLHVTKLSLNFCSLIIDFCFVLFVLFCLCFALFCFGGFCLVFFLLYFVLILDYLLSDHGHVQPMFSLRKTSPLQYHKWLIGHKNSKDSSTLAVQIAVHPSFGILFIQKYDAL